LSKKTAPVASKKLTKKFAHKVKAFCMTRMLEYIMDRLLLDPEGPRKIFFYQKISCSLLWQTLKENSRLFLN
jgi:hypothetical protein